MHRSINVIPQRISDHWVEPYGSYIRLPLEAANKTGNNWNCWAWLTHMGSMKPAVGMVTTAPCFDPIDKMEREPKAELLIPITGAVIQTVALPGDLSDHSEQPDATTVRAFVIEPGEAILMAPGTWHWAALPVEDREVLYYFVGEPHGPEPGRSNDPWIPFKDDCVIELQR